MKTVFDIGMFDGSDSQYYLDSGFRVVAVEANPVLVERAQKKFARQLESGQLTCVHAAVGTTCDPIDLTLCGDDLGSSSTLSSWVTNMPLGAIRVPGITIERLLEQFGVPYYLKVDIEGMDRVCILPLTPSTRPEYLSFEVNPDFENLVGHAASIGFRHFKIINEVSFRELANQNNLYDRGRLRVVRMLGFDQPRLVKRQGRFFVSGQSSGPVPWRSAGRWYTAGAIVERWRRAKADNAVHGWYDVHATVE